ncbi:lipopolysaccharide transport periplasmic protein LptA [Roseibium litorale]|uniref:Lipopolysaccharide transport periplasmic protein LptA n=1 Tax=Roseibium litorale TaxID=2803841 RepID=A0ABR9CP31_9HYPH|nr:lipopolysaccharide transport periplasmic protein LptA [Roseibium litorale]MBD8892438.1 lipopolysaccharide transport periplasmic protein LptA [Roseibium litorale]
MSGFLKSAIAGTFCLLSLAAASQAQTFSNAFAGFGSSDKEPIQIEASELQVEDKSNSATFTGSVVVSQGETRMKTDHLKVFYDGSAAGDVQQKISRLEASGSVYISSKDQTATGDQASFDMTKEIMVMTGKEVVLSQGPNVVVGNKLTVNLKTGKADLQAPSSGRVKVLIQPNSLNKK